MRRFKRTEGWRVLRMAIVAMFACLFVFQNLSSAIGHGGAAAASAIQAQADCGAQPEEHPVKKDSHASHCCLAGCDRHSGRILLFIASALASVIDELTPGDDAHAVYRTPGDDPFPTSGWATSWASRAPPVLS